MNVQLATSRHAAGLTTGMASPTPRIAFVSHTAELGGAERSLIEMVGGLRERGVVPLVVCPARGPLVETFERMGVPCRVVAYSWWSNPVRKVRRNLNNVAAVGRLARLFGRERVDLVYSSTMTIPSAAIAARLCGLPHIWHVHEFGRKDHELDFDLGNRLSRRLVGALSDQVVCVSDAVRDELRPFVDAGKLRTVYGTVSLRETGTGRPRAAPDEPARCVLTGVLRPSKGQKDAIEAIALLRGQGLEVDLTLVGSGPMEAELRRLVVDKGLADRVTFTGWVDNPAPFVEEADIVLMCSRCEAFARAVMEGLMVGRPVIGSRSGGTVEAVQEEVNGLLYTPGDVPELAARIRRLATDRVLARRLGENGRAWSRERFTLDRFADGMMETIRAVLDARGPGRAREPGGPAGRAG